MRAGAGGGLADEEGREERREEGAHVTFSDSHRSNCGGIIAAMDKRTRTVARARGARVDIASEEQREHFTVAAASAPPSFLPRDSGRALSFSLAGVEHSRKED